MILLGAGLELVIIILRSTEGNLSLFLSCVVNLLPFPVKLKDPINSLHLDLILTNTLHIFPEANAFWNSIIDCCEETVRLLRVYHMLSLKTIHRHFNEQAFLHVLLTVTWVLSHKWLMLIWD